MTVGDGGGCKKRVVVNRCGLRLLFLSLASTVISCTAPLLLLLRTRFGFGHFDGDAIALNPFAVNHTTGRPDSERTLLVGLNDIVETGGDSRGRLAVYTGDAAREERIGTTTNGETLERRALEVGSFAFHLEFHLKGRPRTDAAGGFHAEGLRYGVYRHHKDKQ